jgi:hypothetical protein
MPALALIEACADCQQDLEHCHGTAIAHIDGTGDCTDDDACRLAIEQHLYTISCSEVDCPCGAPLPEAGRTAANAVNGANENGVMAEAIGA